MGNTLSGPVEVHRPEFLVTLVSLPETAVVLLQQRMFQVWRDLCQRAQYKGVFSNLRPGQPNAITLPHQIVIQQHINIQSTGAEFGMRPISSITVFNLLEPAAQTRQRPFCIKTRDQVIKGSTVKADRLALIDGGNP